MVQKITRIKILGNGYHGKPVKNIFLPGGTYEADDPLLNGQAEYLVKNGHAEVTGEEKITEAEEKAALEDRATDDHEEVVGEDESKPKKKKAGKDKE